MYEHCLDLRHLNLAYFVCPRHAAASAFAVAGSGGAYARVQHAREVGWGGVVSG